MSWKWDQVIGGGSLFRILYTLSVVRVRYNKVWTIWGFKPNVFKVFYESRDLSLLIESSVQWLVLWTWRYVLLLLLMIHRELVMMNWVVPFWDVCLIGVCRIGHRFLRDPFLMGLKFLLRWGYHYWLGKLLVSGLKILVFYCSLRSDGLSRTRLVKTVVSMNVERLLFLRDKVLWLPLWWSIVVINLAALELLGWVWSRWTGGFWLCAWLRLIPLKFWLWLVMVQCLWGPPFLPSISGSYTIFWLHVLSAWDDRLRFYIGMRVVVRSILDSKFPSAVRAYHWLWDGSSIPIARQITIPTHPNWVVADVLLAYGVWLIALAIYIAHIAVCLLVRVSTLQSAVFIVIHRMNHRCLSLDRLLWLSIRLRQVARICALLRYSNGWGWLRRFCGGYRILDLSTTLHSNLDS